MGMYHLYSSTEKSRNGILNLEKITIAFPCISTGIYRYPKEEACLIAIDTIEEIDNQNIDVIFVCFGDYDYELYCQNLYGKCK